MLPFGVTIPATVPRGSEIPEGLMDNPVYNSALVGVWNSDHQNPSGDSGCISRECTEVTNVAVFFFFLGNCFAYAPTDVGVLSRHWPRNTELILLLHNRCRPVWSRRSTSEFPVLTVTWTLHFTLRVAVEGHTSWQVLGDPCTNPVFIPLRSVPTLNHYSLLSPVDTSSCPWLTSDTKPIIFLFLQTAPFRISLCICNFFTDLKTSSYW